MKSYTILHMKFYLGCTIPVKFDIFLWYKIILVQGFCPLENNKLLNFRMDSVDTYTYRYIEKESVKGHSVA